MACRDRGALWITVGQRQCENQTNNPRVRRKRRTDTHGDARDTRPNLDVPACPSRCSFPAAIGGSQRYRDDQDVTAACRSSKPSTSKAPNHKASMLLIESGLSVREYADRAGRSKSSVSLSDETEDGASMAVTALPHHSTMCFYFDSSHRCRTRSPYIGRTCKSYSRFDLPGSPHTTDSPERAQLPETRCRELSCKGS